MHITELFTNTQQDELTNYIHCAAIKIEIEISYQELIRTTITEPTLCGVTLVVAIILNLVRGYLAIIISNSAVISVA